MAKRPIVLIHGYSDTSLSFQHWIDALQQMDADQSEVTVLHACNYATLTNEVTLKDIAEGFDRALRVEVGLSKTEDFDAIVHSTGMLVIRAWLTAYGQSERRGHLKHLIGLAPATFGSPLAQKGRSWIGAVFKGQKHFGPDFCEAGDLVLDALELASPFTWNLAHQDLLGKEPFYGSDTHTPYVFTFCGTEDYGDLIDVIDYEPGTDGTVRWAGCALNTRKICVDLSVEENKVAQERVMASHWSNVDIPFIPIAGNNHATLLHDPSEELISMVQKALAVSSQDSYNDLCEEMRKRTQSVRATIGQWQQFIVHVVDERGDGVPDYNLQLYSDAKQDGSKSLVKAFTDDVNTYSKDASFRCFHINLKELNKSIDIAHPKNLWLRIVAMSGSALIAYTGYSAYPLSDAASGKDEFHGLDSRLPIPERIKDSEGREISLFHPFTTTLIEITINREPVPFNPTLANKLVTFVPFCGDKQDNPSES